MTPPHFPKFTNEPAIVEDIAVAERGTAVTTPRARRGLIIFAVALFAAWTVYQALPLEVAPRKGLALLTFVAIMWLSEAVHTTVTALMVPVGALMLGFEGFNTSKMLTTFADPTIFLFFGGFAIATALHVQKLDRKIAFYLIALSGSHLGLAIVLLLLVTAGLSMWISNTATAAMMLPLVLGFMENLGKTDDARNVRVFLLLGMAYAASIGGLGTLVGSPPNVIAAQRLGMDFAAWMKLGLPLMLIMLPLMLLVLWFMLRPNLNRRIEIPHEDIPWTPRRILTIVVFVLTAVCWIFSGPLVKTKLGISSPDTFIAIAAIVAVVTLGLASWQQVSAGTEWGVLLLFGGGLTLSALLKSSGAAAVLGDAVASALGGTSPLLVMLGTALFIIFLTEFTSNSASAALLVPVFAAIAKPMGMPEAALVMMIGVGASFAFMMPVATPPNAIVFGSGQLRQSDMVRAGLVLNIVSTLLLGLWGWLVLL
ncbi:MAG: DASS family sodium-coupled anion symporter [Ottowia sp.]|nr:DASS family sodium-coupled anion symporter [Ottowia sp.]